MRLRPGEALADGGGRCAECFVTCANCWSVRWGGFGPLDRCCTACTHGPAPKGNERTKPMRDLLDSEMPR